MVSVPRERAAAPTQPTPCLLPTFGLRYMGVRECERGPDPLPSVSKIVYLSGVASDVVQDVPSAMGVMESESEDEEGGKEPKPIRGGGLDSDSEDEGDGRTCRSGREVEVAHLLVNFGRTDPSQQLEGGDMANASPPQQCRRSARRRQASQKLEDCGRAAGKPGPTSESVAEPSPTKKKVPVAISKARSKAAAAARKPKKVPVAKSKARSKAAGFKKRKTDQIEGREIFVFVYIFSLLFLSFLPNSLWRRAANCHYEALTQVIRLASYRSSSRTSRGAAG